MTQMLSSSKTNRMSSVFWGAVRRYKSVWILYAVMLMVLGPVFLAVAIFNGDHLDFGGLPTEVLFHMVPLGMACILPLLLFSYINDRQALDVYHALPVTRGRLYWGTALAGLLMLMLPYLVLGTACGLICRILVPDDGMLLNLANVAIVCLALYAIMVFIMVNCGTLFESIVYFGIVQLCFPLCIWAVSNCLSEMTFGWNEPFGEGFLGFLLNFSPGYQLLYRVLESSRSHGFGPENLQLLFLAAAAFIGGMALYRSRKSESAGNSFAFKPLFYVGSLMSSITIGLGIYLAFEDVRGRMAVGVIVGVLCYFILDTIRNRGLSRVKETAAVSFGALVAVGMFFGLARVTGTFGHEQYLPSVAGVQSVAVQWRAGDLYLSTEYPLTQQEDILLVEEFHQSVIDNRRALQLYGDMADREKAELSQLPPLTGDYRPFPFELDTYSPYAFGDSNVLLVYTMADGRQVRRYYNSVPLALTMPLYEVAGGEGYQQSQLKALEELQNAQLLDNVQLWYLYLNDSYSSASWGVTSEDVRRILEAACTDLKNRPEDWNVHPASRKLATLELSLREWRPGMGEWSLPIELPVYDIDEAVLDCLKSLSVEMKEADGEAAQADKLEDTNWYEATLLSLEDYRQYMDSYMVDGSVFHFAGQYVYRLRDLSNKYPGQYSTEYFRISEDQKQQLMKLCTDHYISETPMDVLVLDGEGYLIYPGKLDEVKAVLAQASEWF